MSRKGRAQGQMVYGMGGCCWAGLAAEGSSGIKGREELSLDSLGSNMKKNMVEP